MFTITSPNNSTAHSELPGCCLYLAIQLTVSRLYSVTNWPVAPQMEHCLGSEAICEDMKQDVHLILCCVLIIIQSHLSLFSKFNKMQIFQNQNGQMVAMLYLIQKLIESKLKEA